MHNVCQENILVASGENNIDFSKVVNFNETANVMWEAAGKAGDFTAQTLADALMKEYEVDAETALKDAEAMIEEWINIGLVEE